LSELAARAGAALCVRDREGRVLAATAEIDPGGPGVLARDIVTGSRTEAELLAVPGPRFDLELLHHVQTVLAAELLRRRSIADVERRIAGDLVESIMAGEIRPRELRRKAAAFGLGGERPLTFAVLRPQPAGALPGNRRSGTGRCGKALPSAGRPNDSRGRRTQDDRAAAEGDRPAGHLP